MNKTIIIAVAVIAVLGIGGYIVYASMNSSPSMNTDNTQAGQTTDQVQAQEVTVGTGAEATPGSEVSVLYVGQLADGTVFDSSAAHGNQPLTFVLGAEGMIPGFQIGVNGMREGGERLIAIPPSLGYGAQEIKDASGKVIIPSNSTIIFDIKLVKVTPPAAAANQ
jgi:FKBP-type peptidyl-prolyl cis-trans isomerase FkpA